MYSSFLKRAEIRDNIYKQFSKYTLIKHPTAKLLYFSWGKEKRSLYRGFRYIEVRYIEVSLYRGSLYRGFRYVEVGYIEVFVI